jgi:hypothetical protein
LYIELIQTLVERQEDYSENKLAIFSTIAGSAYKKGGIMVVGRAVNGWKYNLDSTDSQSVTNCLSAIGSGLEKDNLRWVGELWGKNQTGEKGRYNTKKSAFWRLIEGIVGLQKLPEENRFFTDYVVWSNLYKVAKSKDDTSGGNPSASLCDVQFYQCQEILDTEIDMYEPAVIVFLTGVGWASPFINDATDRNDAPDNKYIKQAGLYRGRKYVIGPHPQGKNKALYLEEISRYLR